MWVLSELPSSTPQLPIDASQIIDVWSRTAPKYRRRAALLLVVTIALFAGLCVFTFWLRTGAYAPWSDFEFYRALMWRSFDPVGPRQVTLVDFLLFPISVEQVPIQWVIIGLLLASLSSIPILVAILYRFPSSVIFAVMVGGLAAMPWLGLTILLGCAIASLRPLRLSFRYASALLGLIPVVIYFVSASQHPDPAFTPTPFRAKLAAPWVLAGIGSCVICAIALGIARLINYRPGGIAPLLAVLFAVPVVLFHTQVGRDELDYRVLEHQVGPGSDSVFVPRALADEARRDATQQWAETSGFSLNAVATALLTERRAGVPERLAHDRAQVRARCEAFLERFQDSRYVPNALYLMGRATDLRIDALLLGDDLVRYHPLEPRAESQSTWNALVENYGDNPLSAFALHQIAVFQAAAGALDEAVAALDALLGRFDVPVTASRPAARDNAPAGLFGRAAASVSLGFDPHSVTPGARRLRELIVDGRRDDRFGDEPLRRLLALSERHPAYPYNLARIGASFPGARIEPRIAIRLARLNPARRAAIEQLRRIADDYADAPVAAEALYFLGRALEDHRRLSEARDSFAELLRRHPASPYARDARDRWAPILMLEPGETASGG